MAQAHVHGCGHPVRPVILCDDPFPLILSGWLDWNDEHDSQKPCICFFCWEKRQPWTEVGP